METSKVKLHVTCLVKLRLDLLVLWHGLGYVLTVLGE